MGSDVLIGAPFADPGGMVLAGQTYVLFGRAGGFAEDVLQLSDLNASTGLVIRGGSSGDQAGWSVAGAGDCNGDGIQDILIGAYRANPDGKTEAGATYVVYGRAGGFGGATLELSELSASTGLIIDGLAAYDGFGYSVAAAGNFNGDGIDDLSIGAPYQGFVDRRQAGATYVIYGRAGSLAGTLELGNLTAATGLVIRGIRPISYAGLDVTGVGDVIGDGVDDILIAAPQGDWDGVAAVGEAHVVYGRAGGFVADFLELSALDTSTTGFSIASGEQPGTQFGRVVAGAGDLNGDSANDVLIGTLAPGVGIYAHVLYGTSQLAPPRSPPQPAQPPQPPQPTSCAPPPPCQCEGSSADKTSKSSSGDQTELQGSGLGESPSFAQSTEGRAVFAVVGVEVFCCAAAAVILLFMRRRRRKHGTLFDRRSAATITKSTIAFPTQSLEEGGAGQAGQTFDAFISHGMSRSPVHA
jgi:hypothetical protein